MAHKTRTRKTTPVSPKNVRAASKKNARCVQDRRKDFYNSCREGGNTPGLIDVQLLGLPSWNSFLAPKNVLPDGKGHQSQGHI